MVRQPPVWPHLGDSTAIWIPPGSSSASLEKTTISFTGFLPASVVPKVAKLTDSVPRLFIFPAVSLGEVIMIRKIAKGQQQEEEGGAWELDPCHGPGRLWGLAA